MKISICYNSQIHVVRVVLSLLILLDCLINQTDEFFFLSKLRSQEADNKKEKYPVSLISYLQPKISEPLNFNIHSHVNITEKSRNL